MDNEKQQLEKLKKRISKDLFPTETEYINTLEILLEDSKYIALSTIYPFKDDYSDIELPNRYYNWQLKACVELYNLGDKAGTVGYSENGTNFSRKSDLLSEGLMSQIMPKASAPAPRKKGI